MITDVVKQYIDEHKVCSDILFNNWEEFLKLLFSEGGCVESILWFEYVLISEQKNSLGGGGYVDKDNSDYMYAETFICQNNMEDKSIEEVDEYIKSIISYYPNHKLIPSFYIV